MNALTFLYSKKRNNGAEILSILQFYIKKCTITKQYTVTPKLFCIFDVKIIQINPHFRSTRTNHFLLFALTHSAASTTAERPSSFLEIQNVQLGGARNGFRRRLLVLGRERGALRIPVATATTSDPRREDRPCLEFAIARSRLYNARIHIRSARRHAGLIPCCSRCASRTKGETICTGETCACGDVYEDFRKMGIAEGARQTL